MTSQVLEEKDVQIALESLEEGKNEYIQKI